MLVSKISWLTGQKTYFCTNFQFPVVLIKCVYEITTRMKYIPVKADIFEIIPMGMEYLNGVSVTDQDVVYVTGFLSNTVHKIETQGESSA
jgi:hypothetical protein